MPERLSGQASMVAIVEAFYDLGVHVVIFTDVEDARKWLVKM